MYDSTVVAAVAAARAEYERRVQEILSQAGGAVAPPRTQSGLPLRTLYTPADVSGLDFFADLGFPGEFPYT
ncbi:MAG: methylmalonyl-CoA mutase, partial [Candidatus Rokubacteria bacterium]|nr:methylmalonyl-CoA mutase [Candidatus Rokubacteria bacterium]